VPSSAPDKNNAVLSEMDYSTANLNLRMCPSGWGAFILGEFHLIKTLTKQKFQVL
jgi:hypothetical protein